MSYNYGGAPDLFMEIIRNDGSRIEGESQDADYKKHIEIDTFSFGGPSFESVGQGGKKKKNAKEAFKNILEKGKQLGWNEEETAEKLQDQLEKEDRYDTYCFVIRKEYDASSPELLQSYSNNLMAQSNDTMDLFRTVTIRCRIETASQLDVIVLQMEFANAYVVEYEMEISDEESIPDETIKFKFSKVRMTYMPQTIAGEAAKPPVTAGWDFQAKGAWSGSG